MGARIPYLLGLAAGAAILWAAPPRRAESHAAARLAPTPPPPVVLDRAGAGRLLLRGGHLELHVSGSPEEMGRQNGTLLARRIRLLLDEYILGGNVISNDPGDPDRRRLLGAVRTMRRALPPSFLRESDACAEAAGIDRDVLLLAQCEGDLRDAAAEACTGYAAFGPATADGRLECGRNLDWWVGENTARQAALVTYWDPAPGEGYRFAAVGFAGILTGWTLLNERGLVVANHLGGGYETRLEAIPTLLLAREIAERAASVEEGIGILRRAPRMRGQIIWIAEDADPARGRPARAVAVEYDAKRLVVREAKDGVLIVTNTNLAFDGEVPDEKCSCSRYQRLRAEIRRRRGRLDGTVPLTAGSGIANSITLHVVEVVPSRGVFEVRHGTLPAQDAVPVRHPFPGRDAPAP